MQAPESMGSATDRLGRRKMATVLHTAFYYLEGRQTMNKMQENRGFAIGLALGVAFGTVFDNVGLGIALGLVFGIMYDRRTRRKTEEDQ